VEPLHNRKALNSELTHSTRSSSYTTAVVLLCLLIWLAGTHTSIASEPGYIADEGPAPGSVDEIVSPMSHAFEKPEKRKPSMFPSIRKRLESLSPFWKDSVFDLNIRSYYFNEDIDIAANNQVAWALGGDLSYKSGWWKDQIQVGATAYTSQGLYAPKDGDGTMLLAPGQKGITVLGQAYLNARIAKDVEASLFRQTFNLPYVNKHDNRMIPNTFEACTIKGLSIYNTDFIVSHITRTKTRDSSTFRYMSEVAGVSNVKKGLTMAGARYSFTEDTYAAAISQYGWDLWNTFYTECAGSFQLTDSSGINLSAQYTDQRSVGDELAGSFSTHVFGGKAVLGHGGCMLTLAFTSTDSNSDIRSPFGGYPGYCSVVNKDFDRAGEDAWLVGLSYDFGSIGIDGLSGFTNYVRGNTPDSGSAASPDQEEFDITVDYRLNYNTPKGIWLRVRSAFVNQKGPGAQDSKEIRIILNYKLPLL